MANAFQSDAFQNDAFELDASPSFTADAVLLKTIESLFTADAQLTTGLVTVGGTFTAEAWLAGTFTADAVLLKTVSVARTMNAVLKGTVIGSFTANAYIGTVPTFPLLFADDFDNRTTVNVPGTPSGPGLLNNLPATQDYEISGGVLSVQSGDQEYKSADLFHSASSYSEDIYADVYASEGGYYYFVTSTYDTGVPGLTRYRYVYGEVFDDGGNWVVDLPGLSGVGVAGLTNGTWYRVRFWLDSEGMVSKAKMWDRSLSEPTDWLVQSSGASQQPSDFYPHGNIYVSWVDDNNAPVPSQLDNVEIRNTSARTNAFAFMDAVLQTVTTGTFTADSWFEQPGGGGTFSFTFTADAYIIADTTVASFTADARLKTITNRTLTADSYLVSRTPGWFTADAWFSVTDTRTFTANAVLYRPSLNNDPSITKRVSMSILQHRERPLPTYIPPQIPDQEEVPGDPLGGPPCLPPCPGAGAGYGTGYGANGGAIVYTVTRCDNVACGTSYMNSADGWLGRGANGFNTHCGCETSHSYSSHTNRMWITYSNMPTGRFRMRARLVWDVGSDPNVTVNVFAGATAPTLELGDCDTDGSYWDSGIFIGRMVFSADGAGAIGERDVWFQELPSELVIDAGSISGNTFRFELDDESQFYRAEFKAANTQITVD